MDKQPGILIAVANQNLGHGIQGFLSLNDFSCDLASSEEELVALISQQTYRLIVFGPLFVEKIPQLVLENIKTTIPESTPLVILSFEGRPNEKEVKALAGKSVVYLDIHPDSVLQYVNRMLDSASPG